MSKLLIITMIFLNFSLFSESLELFFDWNNASTYELENGMKLKKQDEDFSYTLEAYNNGDDSLLLGWGISMSKVRLSDYNKNKVVLTPIYVSTKYYLTNNSSGLNVFVKAHGGGYLTKNFLGKTDISNPNTIKFKEGFYYGMGLGLEWRSFILQTMYKEYKGKVEVNGNKTELDYFTTSISLGYRFGV